MYELYVGLEADEMAIEPVPVYSVWGVKPKLHLLMHLVMEGMRVHGPACHYWTYLDESFGGKVAPRAHTKGGPRTASKQAETVLLRLYNLGEFS